MGGQHAKEPKRHNAQVESSSPAGQVEVVPFAPIACGGSREPLYDSGARTYWRPRAEGRIVLYAESMTNRRLLIGSVGAVLTRMWLPRVQAANPVVFQHDLPGVNLNGWSVRGRHFPGAFARSFGSFFVLRRSLEVGWPGTSGGPILPGSSAFRPGASGSFVLLWRRAPDPGLRCGVQRRGPGLWSVTGGSLRGGSRCSGSFVRAWASPRVENEPEKTSGRAVLETPDAPGSAASDQTGVLACVIEKGSRYDSPGRAVDRAYWRRGPEPSRRHPSPSCLP